MQVNENILDLDLEKKKLSFKTKRKCRIMSHIFEEYSENEIRQMMDMYEGFDGNYGLKLYPGEEIEGNVVGESSDDFLIDIGYKDYVRVEKKKDEISSLSDYADDDGAISSDTKVKVLLTDVRENPYYLKGSLSALSKQNAYEDIIDKAETHAIEAKVLNWNPAGFDLDLLYDNFKIPAFIPNTLAGINKLTEKRSQNLIGKTVKVMIESYSRNKGTFITSRKKYLKTLIPETLDKISIVDKDGSPLEYEGEVTGTTDFGIFVEFNDCLTGMIHKDNLDEKHLQLLKNRNINPGSTIKFHVKEIVRGKLILTQVWRKTLWDTIKKDDEFDTTIKSFKNFGALVRLDEETVGLIHTSELAKTKKNFDIGDPIKVKVISVQRMERKIYLSVVRN